nr:MAG TPA: hypothetical protein [Caudoviricetes sp.]
MVIFNSVRRAFSIETGKRIGSSYIPGAVPGLALTKIWVLN